MYGTQIVGLPVLAVLLFYCWEPDRNACTDLATRPDTETLPMPDITVVPLLGIAAYSGTGKTTLLRQLIPLLSRAGIRAAVVKQAHPAFEVDQPGKDSYELRKAGAAKVMVVSHRRWALMAERVDNSELSLYEVLAQINTSDVDAVLVEGFRSAPIPKLELHRVAVGKPWLFPSDETIVAVASDTSPPVDTRIPTMNIDDLDKIASFVMDFFGQRGVSVRMVDHPDHKPSFPETAVLAEGHRS